MQAALKIVGAAGFAAALCAAQPCYAWRLEAGQATTFNTFSTPSFTSVTFQQSFDAVPVVVALASNQGGDPSALRIRNITLTGFEIAALEPPGNDGPHAAMTFHYVAIEPGAYTMPGGNVIAAGTHTTSALQASGVVSGTKSWDTVSFGATLPSSAAVTASLQTMNSESGTIPSGPSQPWLSVAVRNPSTTSAQMAIERSEVAACTLSAETIGWIAFPSARSDSFVGVLGGSIGWEARQSADSIVGWDNGCTAHTFSGISWANARVVATKNRRDGGDGGWLRRCSLSGTQVGLVMDEDLANDTERAHTTESAGILAFSDSFHAVFNGQISAAKTVALISDPIHGASGAYALPGALMRYTIAAQSSGNSPIDSGSVVIIDEVPAGMVLKVSDIDGPGTGPVRFTDGSPSSTLSYSYSGLASTGDDVAFSNNGGASYVYTPVPGGDGGDSAVTHIRITPQGSFAANTGAGLPNFSVSFDAYVE